MQVPVAHLLQIRVPKAGNCWSEVLSFAVVCIRYWYHPLCYLSWVWTGKIRWHSKLVGCFFLQHLLIGCAGLVDRITKGDVLVGPDVAKRLAMGLSCLNPLKLRPVSMSDIASKNIKIRLPKREIQTVSYILSFLKKKYIYILCFIVSGIPV